MNEQTPYVTSSSSKAFSSFICSSSASSSSLASSSSTSSLPFPHYSSTAFLPPCPPLTLCSYFPSVDVSDPLLSMPFLLEGLAMALDYNNGRLPQGSNLAN